MELRKDNKDLAHTTVGLDQENSAADNAKETQSTGVPV